MKFYSVNLLPSGAFAEKIENLITIDLAFRHLINITVLLLKLRNLFTFTELSKSKIALSKCLLYWDIYSVSNTTMVPRCFRSHDDSVYLKVRLFIGSLSESSLATVPNDPMMVRHTVSERSVAAMIQLNQGLNLHLNQNGAWPEWMLSKTSQSWRLPASSPKVAPPFD